MSVEQDESQSILQEKGSTVSPKKRRWLAWTLVALMCVVLALPLLHRPAMSGAMPAGGPPGGPPGGGGSGGPGAMTGANTATLVNVAQVETGPMDIYLDALGTVTPLQTVNVYSLVSGKLLSVHYREGQFVQQGDLLAEIDPRPYEAQLKQAQGTLARDRAVLEQAHADLKRYQDALQENAIAAQTVTDEEAAVHQDEGTVQNDEGTVEYDQVQLSYCHITAPISGRIGLRLVDAGNVIFSGSSTTIATITELNPITVVFSIAEDHLTQLQDQLNKRKALQVDLFDRAGTTKLISGKLLTLDNQVDTSTGTVRLRAEFDNAKNQLFPNQFVNARLVVDTLPQARLVPTVAIQYNGQQAFVYLVKPDKAVALTKVTVLGSEQSNSAVQGLSAGDTVVTSNFDRIQDGSSVTVATVGSPEAGMGGPSR
jgi:multidrug efflux system membrane fusion protein